MYKIFKKIQRIIPPILFDLIKKYSGYLGYSIWEYAPKGFSTNIKKNGWDLESIAKQQYDKWNGYSQRIKSKNNFGINHESSDYTISNDPFFHNLLASFAYVITLSGLKKESIEFLDWGGGVGHYGLLAEELVKSANLKLSYYCFDFPIFCEYGKKLNPNYHYFSDENSYQNNQYDLVMASSSIWYEDDWKIGVDKLCKFKTNYLYITRMIFISEHASYVAIQRPKLMGYDTEYLFWIINREEFTDYINQKGFSLIREFEFGEVPPIFKGPEQGTMKGFLFKKNN